MQVLGMLRSTSLAIFRSLALRTAAKLALSGAAFALSNLMLASLLSPEEFGRLALALALIQVGATGAALGRPLLITRHALAPSGALLRSSIYSGIAVAFVIACIAAMPYRLAWSTAILIGTCVGFAALARVGSAFFQSKQKFGYSITLMQSQNWVLLAAAAMVWLIDVAQTRFVLAVMLVGYVAVSVVGWWQAWRDATPRISNIQPSRAEMMSAVWLILAGNLYLQLDRLIMGRMLSLDEFATYSIVAATAGSAFRMLQLGAGFSLVPRLRSTHSIADAASLARREARILIVVTGSAAIGVTLIVPLLFYYMLPRYSVPSGLLLAVVVVGVTRIWQAFAAAVVTALGSPRDLLILSVCAWISIALSTVCALLAVRFGSVGIVYGIAVGSLLYALAASVLACATLSILPSEYARASAPPNDLHHSSISSKVQR